MANLFTHWRRRRALLREAEALEAQARSLERSLLSDLTGGFGPWVGLAAAVGAVVADHKIPALKGIAGVVATPRGRRERIEELRTRAAALREEYLQDIAEGLTRIEGEARHLRATLERLWKVEREG